MGRTHFRARRRTSSILIAYRTKRGISGGFYLLRARPHRVPIRPKAVLTINHTNRANHGQIRRKPWAVAALWRPNGPTYPFYVQIAKGKEISLQSGVGSTGLESEVKAGWKSIPFRFIPAIAWKVVAVPVPVLPTSLTMSADDLTQPDASSPTAPMAGPLEVLERGRRTAAMPIPASLGRQGRHQKHRRGCGGDEQHTGTHRIRPQSFINKG
jgi:hypothetical protein